IIGATQSRCEESIMNPILEAARRRGEHCGREPHRRFDPQRTNDAMLTATMSPIVPRSASLQPAYRAELALLLLLATLCGASYAFIRVGVETIPPVTFIAARTTIAAAVLLGVLRWRGLALPAEPTLWRRLALQACLNSVVPFTLIAWAEQYVDAGLA